MADIVFIAIVVAFFALCVGYVRVCDRIIGPDPTTEHSPDDRHDRDDPDDESCELEMSDA